MMNLEQVTYQYSDTQVLDEVQFKFSSNTFYGIIGPNGAGKSTLLQLLAGLRKPSKGKVTFLGENISTYARKWVAQRIAVLQQGGLPPLGFTVRQVIEMGRFPYQSWLGGEKEDIAPLIEEAIQLTGLSKLTHRSLNQLSGGERQRVALAKLIVQQPDIILLDEPTTYLDIGYQQSMMEVVSKWQKEKQLLVIAVLHDLNLASLYCDELIALHEGKFVGSGEPSKVLTTDLVEQLYGASTVVIPHPDTSKPQLLLVKSKEDE